MTSLHELRSTAPVPLGLGASAPVREPEPLPVVLLSSFPLLRAGLRELLEAAGLEVAGEAAEVDAALELVRGRSRALVVADTDLAGSPPAEIVRRLRSHHSATRVVVLSSATGAAALAALRAGACGYLPKTASRAELVAGLRAAAAIGAGPARSAETRVPVSLPGGAPADGAATLSRREVEVLQLVVRGRDNAEIAAELFISPATAKSHVSHILRKLRAQNRIQAAVFAVRSGIA
jgi:DNA-binding NarL/FixJ family response regulator